MAVITPPEVRHGVYRQGSDHDTVVFLQPCPQPGGEIIARRQLFMELFRRRIDGVEIGRPVFKDMPHLVDRQAGGGERRFVPFPRQKIGKVGKALRLFPVGPVKLEDTACRIGRRICDLDQLLRRRHLTGKQRIGEDFTQLPGGTGALALQIIKIDLIDRGELQKQLHGQRSLVALDEIEIGRRNRQRLGHGRLRQPQTIANAAHARACKNLVFRHRLASPSRRLIQACYKLSG
ncbi:hypothetical protein D3C86_1135500 [compost metagenome]